MAAKLKCPIDPFSLLPSSTTLRHLHQLHAHLLAQGFLSHHPLHLNKLITLTSPHSLPYSHQILTHSPTPATTFSLNTLIRAHHSPSSFPFFTHILTHPSLSPDNYTFTFLLRAAPTIPSLSSVHASAFKFGFTTNPHVQSALIHMYTHLGSPDSACCVYSALGGPCCTVTRTAFLRALVNLGRVDEARNVFDEMLEKDFVAWNAMIAGYAQVGRAREALEMFGVMMRGGVRVNEVTLVSVLSACAQLGALEQGEWVHVYVERKGLRVGVTLGTALVDMYSKCGDMERGMQVFCGMGERNVYTWSSALGGLAMNGFGSQCLELFEQMKEHGVEPNGITFVSVLRACSVAGLVEKGREHFNSMKSCYGIEPWPEHYGCVVDLYGRAGLLKEALGFIISMPIKPHTGAWGALLNACRIHKNTELGELAMRKIVEMESDNDGAYVLLSNIYADSRNWKGVSSVRELMKGRGVNKEPGCSVVEVGGEVHEFFVGDRSHSRYKEIQAMLGEMRRRLRMAGYFAKINEVLFDIEEEEKEDALCLHSEKLAVAFGLIAVEEGAAIRVVKNLRVCWDCHESTKVISKVFGREIIMRDRNRFHHFKDGVCSCKDYW